MTGPVSCRLLAQYGTHVTTRVWLAGHLVVRRLLSFRAMSTSRLVVIKADRFEFLRVGAVA
jgi:hypothetical protein